MRIETERLILRNYQESDIEDYWEYVSQLKVGPMCGWQPYTKKEDAKKRLQIEIAKPLQFAILLKKENKVIGSIELMYDEDIFKNYKIDNTIDCKEVGCLLSENYWGQGIMTEAMKAIVKFGFDYLHLDCMVASYFSPNNASGKMQKKAGFTPYGKIENCYTWLDGKSCDLILCKMFKDDYEKNEIYKNKNLKIIDELEENYGKQ